MARRDQRPARGRRAAARRRAPGFILSDGEEDVDDDGTAGGILPVGIKHRTKKQYDERRHIDDAEGAEEEDELPAEQLSDIKAGSIGEWIAIPRVKKTIQKLFRNFLVTCVDANGASVYGERIKTLGESTLSRLFLVKLN